MLCYRFYYRLCLINFYSGVRGGEMINPLDPSEIERFLVWQAKAKAKQLQEEICRELVDAYKQYLYNLELEKNKVNENRRLLLKAMIIINRME